MYVFIKVATHSKARGKGRADRGPGERSLFWPIFSISWVKSVHATPPNINYLRQRVQCLSLLWAAKGLPKGYLDWSGIFISDWWTLCPSVHTRAHMLYTVICLLEKLKLELAAQFFCGLPPTKNAVATSECKKQPGWPVEIFNFA